MKLIIVYDLFQSSVGKKLIERIANRLWPNTKIAVFGPPLKFDLRNDPLLDEILPVKYYYNYYKPIGDFKNGLIPNL